jgi:hypothetical protein
MTIIPSYLAGKKQGLDTRVLEHQVDVMVYHLSHKVFF